MIHRHRVLLALLTLTVLFFSISSHAASLPTVSATLKNAGAVDPAGQQQIQSFVTTAIQQIVTGTSTEQTQARDALVAESKLGSQPASPGYQAAYCRTVATAVATALGTARDARAKLNLAVAVAKIAQNAPRAELAPVVEQLLSDKEAVLHLWGARATHFLLPELVHAGTQGKLIAMVVANARQQLNASMTDEAYEVLTPADVRQSGVLQAIADPLLDLTAARVAKLESGYPPDPYLESKPLLFLAQTSVWPKITPEQRLKAMQTVVNVVTWGSLRADEQKANLPTREQLGILMNKTAGSLWVIGNIIKTDATDAATKNAAANLVSLADAMRKGSEGVNLLNVNYVQLSSKIPGAIMAIPEFKNLKVPAPARPMAQDQ